MRLRSCAFAIACAAVAIGCGGQSTPAPAPSVTGLVVTIDYSGDVASVEVSGAAETSGRRFGPWTLSTQTLSSGGTVGFIFDPSDGGSAMICAQSRSPDGNLVDLDCGVFPVRAGQVMNGTLHLDDGSGGPR